MPELLLPDARDRPGAVRRARLAIGEKLQELSVGVFASRRRRPPPLLPLPRQRDDDDADKVFIKARFLRGNVLGLRIGASERLNTYKLAASYNSKIQRNIEEMSELINTSCANSFKQWQEKLQGAIEKNITIYNPELRELTEFIREESERILELQTDQLTISNSFKTIEDMMAWKELV